MSILIKVRKEKEKVKEAEGAEKAKEAQGAEEACIKPAVGNGCTENYMEYAFFDLSYASVGAT